MKIRWNTVGDVGKKGSATWVVGAILTIEYFIKDQFKNDEYISNDYYAATGYYITHDLESRGEDIIAGPFDSLDVAKSAYLLLMGNYAND